MSTPTPGHAWEFACSWYGVDEIYHSLSNPRFRREHTVPEDTRSREFAEWLTDQYRLAMAKGIQIGREWEARKQNPATTI